jgi:transcriptional regulator with XRE-family HTH domain
MTIEKIISEKRKSMGLTQQQLAEKLHVSYVEIENDSLKKMLQNINTMEVYKEIL